MFSHVSIGTDDFPKTFEFYRRIAEPLGLTLKFSDADQRWAAWQQPGKDRPLLFITRPFDGKAALVGNGQMVAFVAGSHDAVDRCHAAAIEAGGISEGAPGLRVHYHPNYYGAYFRDLEGNKLCVCCHDAAGIFKIRNDDLSGQPTIDLLTIHLAGMHANSPPDSVFALDLSGLQRPDVRVWTAWEGPYIAGIAAFRMLSDSVGEVKSMRTHPSYLRRGVARRFLEFIIAEAMASGMTTLCLETGSGAAFDPALELYRRHGFVNGPAFAEYEQSDFNQFLYLDLGAKNG